MRRNGELRQHKSAVRLPIATLVAITRLRLCAAPVAFADDNSFVGKWKFNPDKSQLNGLTYKFDQGENDHYKFTFGDDTETICPANKLAFARGSSLIPP